MPKYESWSHGAAVRKAGRQSPVVDDAPKTRGVPNNRKTKIWCKGKVGVEHKMAVSTYVLLKGWDARGCGTLGHAFKGWLIRYCSVCGKELENYMPPLSGMSSTRVIPDWAVAYFAEHPDVVPESLRSRIG